MPNYLDYTVKLEPYAYPAPGAGSRAENWFNRRFDDVLLEQWKDLDSIHAISLEAAPNGDGGAELAEKLNKVISRDCGDWLRIDFDLDDTDIPDVRTFSSAVWQQTGGGHEGDVIIALYGPEQWSKSIESVVHYMKVKATITW